jgi:hypothetical protein
MKSMDLEVFPQGLSGERLLMGYDMYIVQEVETPGDEYLPQDPSEPRYYRLNWRAMQVMRQIMSLTGIFDEKASHDEWPLWPPEGICANRADDLEEHFRYGIEITPSPTEIEAERITNELVAWDAIRRTRSARPDLVPAFKFRSNDHWFVSPEECRVIADRLREALAFNPASILPDPKHTGITCDEAKHWVLEWGGCLQ